MEIVRDQVKELTNDKELAIYDASQEPALAELSVREVKDLIKRSRDLRDKLRDLKKSQVRSKQTKVGGRGVEPAERSAAKVELFSQVHDIFVERLAFLEADAEDGKTPETSKGSLASAARTRGSDAAGLERSAKAASASKDRDETEGDASHRPQSSAPMPPSRGNIKDGQFARGGVSRKRGHLAATNKRNQARRDSK
jgi:hypothetical protein